MLGNRKPRVYLTLKDGKLQQKESGEVKAEFDYLEGNLSEITTHVHEFKVGVPTELYNFLFEEKDADYVLVMPKRSGPALSIINSLCSAEGLKNLRFDFWKSADGFTQVRVSQKGERLGWKYQDFPKGSSEQDRIKRVKWIDERVGELMEQTVSRDDKKEDTSRDLTGKEMPF